MSTRPTVDETQVREWMAAYQEGSLEAFDCLYASLSPMLRQYLTSLTRDAVKAQDLLQDAFLQIHRSRHTYDAAQPLLPWVFAVTRNVFLMDARSARRRLAKDHVPETETELPIPPEAESLADRLQVRHALQQVKSERREALLLHHVWGLSFREIARMLGIRESAAKLRSSRGMSDLRVLLADTRMQESIR